MNSQSKQTSQLADELEQIVAMNPNLSLDELELVMQRKMDLRNNQPLEAFCGLSPNQMSNWLNGSFSQLQGVSIATPEDLSQSPVMRYLGLIVDEAIEGGGSFKATAKGNLPAKLGKVRTSPRTALAYEQKRVRGIQIKEGWLPFKAEYQRDRDCSKAP